MGSAGFINSISLPQSVVFSTRWFTEWDSLVYMTFLQILNFALGETAAAVGIPGNNLTILMSLVSIVTVLFTLTKVLPYM
jgi:hypothetical protein